MEPTIVRKIKRRLIFKRLILILAPVFGGLGILSSLLKFRTISTLFIIGMVILIWVYSINMWIYIIKNIRRGIKTSSKKWQKLNIGEEWLIVGYGQFTFVENEKEAEKLIEELNNNNIDVYNSLEWVILES